MLIFIYYCDWTQRGLYKKEAYNQTNPSPNYFKNPPHYKQLDFTKSTQPL